MPMLKFKDVLNYFGLTDPEVAVYLSCLELGARPASMIAKKAALKRGHTYNILAALIEKGLVQEYAKGGVRYFVCSPPGSLVSIAEQREEKAATNRQQLVALLPELEKLRSKASVQPKVRFYQGVEGLKEVLEDTIRVPGQPIYALSNAGLLLREVHPELSKFMPEYIQRRIARNCWFYGIANFTQVTDRSFVSSKKAKRTVKMIEGLSCHVEFVIYGSKLAMVSFHHPLMGLIVEDTHIVETARALHQAAFKALPPYPA